MLVNARRPHQCELIRVDADFSSGSRPFHARGAPFSICFLSSDSITPDNKMGRESSKRFLRKETSSCQRTN